MANLGRVELTTVEVVAHMPRCRDCRWWDTEDKDHHWIMPPGGRGLCLLAEGEHGDAVHQESMAHAEDGESYRAVLTTAPDFGCVQFEAKDG